MSVSVITNRIKEKIDALEGVRNSIIVLKGIPINLVDENADKFDINLGELIDNKLSYLMKILRLDRKYITYEEFLLMSELISQQFKTIYVLNNNIYMEQYPIDEFFDQNVRVGLLNHFSDEYTENDENAYLGDIEEYTSMYYGIREYNGYLLGAYCDEKIYENNKVININLFDKIDDQMGSMPEEDHEFIEIFEEGDYINLVKNLFNNPDELYVRTDNYTGDKYKLKERIQMLSYYWKDYTDLYFIEPENIDNEFVHNEEYSKILKKYWGHKEFRTLPVYNMAKLEENKKEVTHVSQENIVANIIEQAEKCHNDNEGYRDIFTTAPTGAGKSVMFQIPAIYLAEKYNLLTIVISPLIGLMNDQVKNLEVKKYKHAVTINSDISPIIKQDVMEKVANGQYHILYISPETLLSRSDVEQLIGDRTIGMIVIDEAHIVTTWGKQFRPDYWYLGNHIRKLRKTQMEKKGHPFIISTFTATAIYHGIEDMYTETVNSLHMLNPITYLGYIKRNDIDIVIKKAEKKKGERSEYEYDKFVQIEDIIKRAIVTNKKTLIYFPTVALINRCFEYLRTKRMIERVALFHGSLPKDIKQESYEKFLNKEKLVMLATKAFGMGIDIDDIELVIHFAPTGNVCDYVQEIGRGARRPELSGEAYYDYNQKDFKHINRLHGLSTIKRYQLIEVIRKIDELYQNNLHKGGRSDLTRKRNAMLLDAENFTYIFGSPISDEDNNINKVKTALLIIQKDFESKIGFSPINVRPIPLFSIGFFEVSPLIQKRILKKYPECLEEIEKDRHICRVMLDKIWRRDYTNMSFPKFKYMIYSRDNELRFNKEFPVKQALQVSISLASEHRSRFREIWSTLRNFIQQKVVSSQHTAVSEMVTALVDECNITKYKAQTICEVVIASMDSYRKNYAKTTIPIATEKTTIDGKTKYQFSVAVNSYFAWVESGYRKVLDGIVDNKLFLVNDTSNYIKEYNVILGILEVLDVLSFEMLGGANSQLYIYVNQIQGLKNILNQPYKYKNRLLETVAERHLISVKMLTYIYENGFTNQQIWDLVEDYFLGVIPEKVKRECQIENPEMKFS